MLSIFVWVRWKMQISVLLWLTWLHVNIWCSEFMANCIVFSLHIHHNCRRRWPFNQTYIQTIFHLSFLCFIPSTDVYNHSWILTVVPENSKLMFDRRCLCLQVELCSKLAFSISSRSFDSWMPEAFVWNSNLRSRKTTIHTQVDMSPWLTVVDSVFAKEGWSCQIWTRVSLA